eukprot:12539794-Alexandrium_andersonii.AAC.1
MTCHWAAPLAPGRTAELAHALLASASGLTGRCLPLHGVDHLHALPFSCAMSQVLSLIHI